MNKEEFELSLRDLGSRPVPPVPGNLTANVLREIRLRRAADVGFAEKLANWLWRPAVASALVPAAVAMGMAMALLAPRAEADGGASQGLYLNVFSESSPTLPSTYIAAR